MKAQESDLPRSVNRRLTPKHIDGTVNHTLSLKKVVNVSYLQESNLGAFIDGCTCYRIV